MTEVIQELSINSAGLSPKGYFDGNKVDNFRSLSSVSGSM